MLAIEGPGRSGSQRCCGNSPSGAAGLITGSTSHDALPAAAESLTGRLHLLSALPLSHGELLGAREDFLEAVMAGHVVVTAEPSTSSRQDYIDRVCAGGFPLAAATITGASFRFGRGLNGRNRTSHTARSGPYGPGVTSVTPGHDPRRAES